MVLNPSHKWETNDVIIRQRANGIIQFPNMVEDGCVVTLQTTPDAIAISSGVVHVGGFRQPYTSSTFLVSPIAGYYYVYAELTADIDLSGDLVGTKNVGFGVYTSPQSFIAPNYGTLIAVVKGTVVPLPNWVYDAARNKGVPFLKDYYANYKTLGAEGCDYQNINDAIERMIDGEVCVCFPDANYNLQMSTVVDAKRIAFVAAWIFDPNISLGSYETKLIKITSTPAISVLTDVWMYATNNGMIVFSGFELNDSNVGLGVEGSFKSQTGGGFVFEKCRITVDENKAVIYQAGGFHKFVDCYTLNTTGKIALTTLDVGNEIYIDRSVFVATLEDGFLYERGSIQIYDSKIYADTAGKIAFQTRVFSGQIYDSLIRSINGTAFDIAAVPSGTLYFKNIELESNNVQMNLQSSGFLIYYSNIKLERIGIPVVPNSSLLIRRRTPSQYFEPIEYQDLNNYPSPLGSTFEFEFDSALSGLPDG